jgi:hypothetical protein
MAKCYRLASLSGAIHQIANHWCAMVTDRHHLIFWICFWKEWIWILTHGWRIIRQYRHSHVGKPAHLQGKDLFLQKILLEEFVDMYQIQQIWNSHVLTSDARLVRSPWYNRERSIWSDMLHHVETYAMHTLSLFSCFFTLNQLNP